MYLSKRLHNHVISVCRRNKKGNLHEDEEIIVELLLTKRCTQRCANYMMFKGGYVVLPSLQTDSIEPTVATHTESMTLLTLLEAQPLSRRPSAPSARSASS